MGEHFATGVEVPVGVVGEGGVEEVAPLVLRQQVQQQRGRTDPLGGGPPLHARLGRRLVIGHVAQRVEAPVVDRSPSPCIPGPGGIARPLQVGQEKGAQRRVAQGTGLLADRQRHGAGVRRQRQQRVKGGLQPHQEPDGTRCHLGADGQAFGDGGLNAVEQIAPGLGMAVALCQREGEGHAGARHHGAHQLELAVGVGPEVGDQLHDAVPGVGHTEGDGLELVGAGPQRGRRIPGGGAVVQRPRCRESDGPVPQGLGRQGAHGRAVLRRRLLQPGGPLAHDVEAQSAVGELRAQVDVVRTPFHRVEILPEALPGPVDPLVEHRARDVLDPFHERDQAGVRVRPHRREADATIAHDRRRDPVPAGRRHPFVPRRLPVVVGVDVDEAGGDQQPAGVDLLGAPARHGAHGGDGPPVHRQVSPPGLAAPAVGHQPAPDHEIVCRFCHALTLTLTLPASRRDS